jgi:RepB DNA-primase from phage plasmid
MSAYSFHDGPAPKRAKAHRERGGAVQNLDEAMRMVDTFASVGATHFDRTLIDIDGRKRAFRPEQSIAQIKTSLPKLFPGAAERQDSIIIRPLAKDVTFIQLDDLGPEGLARVGEAAFLTLQTSPGNHQAWIAVSGIAGKEEAKDFARRLRKGAGADPSATGATRVAGTMNYKRKYEPDFPVVRISAAAPGRIVPRERLEEMGLVAPPEPETAPPLFVARTPQGRGSNLRPRNEKVWPDYARSLAGAPPNRQGNGPDRSMADFSWCMTAIDWGWSIEDTASKLVEVSERARERLQLKDKGYPLITAQNAAAAVERNDRRRGRG